MNISKIVNILEICENSSQNNSKIKRLRGYCAHCRGLFGEDLEKCNSCNNFLCRLCIKQDKSYCILCKNSVPQMKKKCDLCSHKISTYICNLCGDYHITCNPRCINNSKYGWNEGGIICENCIINNGTKYYF